MNYSPQLDKASCTTLRRLAWALGKPMTKTIAEILKFLPDLLDNSFICGSCKDDSKCSDCMFSKENIEKNESNLMYELLTTSVPEIINYYCNSCMKNRTYKNDTMFASQENIYGASKDSICKIGDH